MHVRINKKANMKIIIKLFRMIWRNSQMLFQKFSTIWQNNIFIALLKVLIHFFILLQKKDTAWLFVSRVKVKVNTNVIEFNNNRFN